MSAVSATTRVLAAEAEGALAAGHRAVSLRPRSLPPSPLLDCFLTARALSLVPSPCLTLAHDPECSDSSGVGQILCSLCILAQTYVCSQDPPSGSSKPSVARGPCPCRLAPRGHRAFLHLLILT